MIPRFRLVSASALALLLATSLAYPARGSALQRTPTGSPKLVVILVADQMRTEYLERYSVKFTGGLRRLMRDGAWFQQAAYPYLNTITCAGHSTIGTGTFPYKHGMILNAWFDRKTRKSTECTEDLTTREVSYGGGRHAVQELPDVGWGITMMSLVRLLGLAGPGDSGRRILAPTLADRLREQRGRVVTLSLKDRSAIGLAGHGGDVVMWFDARGAWMTSSAFAKKPIPFLQQFIEQNPIASAYGQPWDRLLEPSAYQNKDDNPAERAPAGWTRTFPHVIGSRSGKPDAEFYGHWMRSPLSDAYMGKMAAATVDAMKLGKGSQVDFLGISFSALDLVGHAFGPNSHEVQDNLARLDVTIGELLTHLDASVGAGNYVVGFSSDHGVAEIPEETRTGGRQASAETAAAIDAALRPFLGPGKYVAHSAYTDIYLQNLALDRMKKDPAVTAAVLNALRALPGIAQAYTAQQIAAPGTRSSSDPIKRAAAMNYFPGRSGDLIIVPRETWILASSATTHGTLYPYDQRVPVILYGSGVTKGRYDGEATPADIAPSLAALVNIRFQTSDGRPRTEAFAPPVSTR